MNKHLTRFLIVLIVLCAFFTLFACQKDVLNENKEEKYNTYTVKLIYKDKDKTSIVRNGYIKLEKGAEDVTFEFLHWNTKADDSGQSFQEKDILKIKSDLTLYAIYRDKNCITLKQPNISKEKYLKKDEVFIFPEFLSKVKENYKFVGWSDKDNGYFFENENEIKGNLYKPNQIFTSKCDATYHAVFVYDLFTFTYKYKDEIYTQDVNGDSKVYLLDCKFTNLGEDLTKYNEFVCWNDKEDGSGTDYKTSEILSPVNITLYPKFARKKVFVIINFENDDAYCLQIPMNVKTKIKVLDKYRIPYTDYMLYDENMVEVDEVTCTSNKELYVVQTPKSYEENIYKLKKNGTYELVRAKTNSKNVKIDELYNNKPVTSIADYAFFKTSIVNLEIPSTIECISNNAFLKCETIKSIKCYATDFEESLYFGLEKVGNITIYCNESVFDKFKYINPKFNLISEELCSEFIYENGLILNSDRTALIGVYDKSEFVNLSIPASVNTICSYAFSYINLENKILKIPETVTCIQSSAFSHSILKKIVFPDNLKVLNKNLMKDSNIKEVVLPNNLEIIKSYALSLDKLCKIYVKNTTVDLNDRINLYNLPLSLKKIESYGIEGLNISITNLKGIDLGQYAIGFCKFINNFNIEDNDSEIADYAFERCDFKNIILNTSVDFSIFYQCNVKYIINKSNGKLKYSGSAFEKCILYIGKNEEIENIESNKIGNINCIILPDTLNKIEDDSIIYLSQNNLDILINDIDNTNDFNGNNYNFGDYHYNQGILYDKEFTKVLACLSESENVVLPETVIEIGDGVFYDNQKLKNINLENIQIIGENAFYNCKNLNEINLTSLETYVDFDLFKNAKMNKIILPKNLTELNDEFVNFQMHDYNFGFKVREIVFNDNLEKIKNGVLDGYLYLKNFKYPQNCIVEENAFRNVHIPKLVIDNTVTEFHSNLYPNAKRYVFHENINDIYFDYQIRYSILKFYSTTLPVLNFNGTFLLDNVTCIVPSGKKAEYEALFKEYEDKYNKITFLEFDKDTSDSDFIYNADKTEIVEYIGNSDLVEIPSFVKKINSNAFKFTNIQKIILNEGLQTIGENAFYYCGNLTSVTIPDTVTEIGKGCFEYCLSLKDVKLSNNLQTLPNSLFKNCKNLVSLIMPNSLISIGDSCFCKCKNLESIELPDCLTSIGNECFRECVNLGSIILPNSVTNIGESGFLYCLKLISVELSQSLNSLNEHTFNSCKSLVSIIIPDSITKIGKYCFADCSSLINVELPKNLENLNKFSFCSCESLKSLVIPNSCENIGGNVFYGTAIKTLHIPENVTSIEKLNRSIESITFDENNNNFVVDVNGIIYNCEKSQIIHIPNNVNSLVMPDSFFFIGNLYGFKTNLRYLKYNESYISLGFLSADYTIGNAFNKDYNHFYIKNVFFDFALTEDFKFDFDKSNVYCLNEFKEEMKGLSYFEKIIFIDEIPSEDVLCKYWNESKNYISKIDGSEACKIDTNNIKTILEIASNCEILNDANENKFDLKKYYKIILSADNIVEMPFDLELNNYCKIYVPEDKYDDYINDDYWCKYKFKILKIS